MISYKPLWVTLAKKSMKKLDLLEVADISRGTLAKMGKNEYVYLKTIDNICKALDCSIQDVIDYIPDKE